VEKVLTELPDADALKVSLAGTQGLRKLGRMLGLWPVAHVRL